MSEEALRHYMDPKRRLVAIQLESPKVIDNSVPNEVAARIIDRYDFNFLMQWAVKGIEAEKPKAKRKGK